MAKVITQVAAQQERLYGYDEVQERTFYITQLGELCFAVSATVFALFDGVMYFNAASDRASIRQRFPLRRAPVGTSVTLIQEEEPA